LEVGRKVKRRFSGASSFRAVRVERVDGWKEKNEASVERVVTVTSVGGR
jgi:hypothetical protein